MFAEERKQQILAVLKHRPAVRATELGRALHVSVASIRRDLADLERSGLLKRTHGGALSRHLATFEPSLAQKEDQFQQEKLEIAKLAVSLVQPGDTVFLDAGSTTRQIAHQLRDRRNLTVVTNALNIASELVSCDFDVILTGGQLRRGVLSQVGPLAEQAIAAMHVDKLFLAANGVDLKKGVTTPNLLEAQTKRTMVEHAREVILVADHSKFGRVTFGRVCRFERLDAVITDDGLPDQVAKAIGDHGVTLHIAGASRGKSVSPAAHHR